jgi:hypothetical protein
VRVAIVDGGSFVLPYDYQLAETLAAPASRSSSTARAPATTASSSRRCGACPASTVHDAALSRTVAPRWRGVLGYLALWLGLWRRRREFDAINLQFSAAWPLELPFLLGPAEQAVFTVPQRGAARLRRPSPCADRADRPARAHARLRQPLLARRLPRPLRRGVSRQARLFGLGRTPVVPGLPPVPYRPAPPPEALVYWSTVKPYKGVELFAELARSQRIRDAGVGLEIHGAWAPELAALQGRARRPRRADRRRLSRRAGRCCASSRATSSSSCRTARRRSRALFSLLHHGRVFLCSDVGDLGDFLRRFGLEALLLPSAAPTRSRRARAARARPARSPPSCRRRRTRAAWPTTHAGIAAVYAGDG